MSNSSKANMNNHANQLNPNNAAYRSSRQGSGPAPAGPPLPRTDPTAPASAAPDPSPPKSDSTRKL